MDGILSSLRSFTRVGYDTSPFTQRVGYDTPPLIVPACSHHLDGGDASFLHRMHAWNNRAVSPFLRRPSHTL